MTTTPTITIFVRQSKTCKYAGMSAPSHAIAKSGFAGRQPANPVNGVRQIPGPGGEAEHANRDIEDQLTGRAVVPDTPGGKNMRAAIEVFLADKKVENLSSEVVRKYEREIGRLASFCEGRGVYTLSGINRELINRFGTDWKGLSPSSLIRNKLAERSKSFLKFCRVAGWLVEVPI